MERLGVGPPWNSSASAHAGRFSLSEVLEASPTIARRMQHQLSLSSELPWVQTRVEARQTAYEGGPKRANEAPVQSRSLTGPPDPEGKGGKRVRSRNG